MLYDNVDMVEDVLEWQISPGKRLTVYSLLDRNRIEEIIYVIIIVVHFDFIPIRTY
jgi:hypothetical protein